MVLHSYRVRDRKVVIEYRDGRRWEGLISGSVRWSGP